MEVVSRTVDIFVSESSDPRLVVPTRCTPTPHSAPKSPFLYPRVSFDSSPAAGVFADPCRPTTDGVEICERGRDDGSHLGGEKKQRLNVDQVPRAEEQAGARARYSYRALGLQPRQVVIWFQNNRGRWKTKQDHDVLKRQFRTIKAERRPPLPQQEAPSRGLSCSI
nr:homeobox-leucine zipper protein HOX23-like [Lolium perenne]